jgi:hypothetical protein
MSCRLLDVVLSQAQLDLDSAQVQHVQDMIDNSQHSSLRQPMHPEQAWRLQVRHISTRFSHDAILSKSSMSQLL